MRYGGLRKEMRFKVEFRKVGIFYGEPGGKYFDGIRRI